MPSSCARIHRAPEAILGYIDKAAEKLHSGDTFIFFFAGHGGQMQDANGDEEKGQDDVLCALGGNILDDDLAIRWKKFKPDVRIVMLSDSCHSGTNHSMLMNIVGFFNNLFGRQNKNAKPVKQIRNSKPINFKKTKLATDGMQAQLIHFGACSDDQLSNADPAGGDFTIALTIIWEMNKGNFSGYEEFYEEVVKELPTVLKERHNEVLLQYLPKQSG